MMVKPADILGKTPLRGLIVEDDSYHYMYLKQLLERAMPNRVVVEWTKDAPTAITRLKAEGFDFCLLDFLLQDGDARLVLEHSDPAALDTAFIVVSAHEDRAFVNDALRWGADDYLIKGNFNAAELERAVQFSLYRKQKERALRQKALYDPLTGLANRSLLLDRLEEIRKYAKRNHGSFAVAMIDIDRLKQVNDSFGHEAGDLLIRAVSAAVSSALRESDVVARVGGDELIAVLRDIHDRDGLAQVCTTLIEAVRRERLFIRGQPLAPSCSIGAALFPNAAADLTSLLHQADRAMYDIKRTGGDGWRLAEGTPEAAISDREG